MKHQGLSEIFLGSSPFGDGKLEALDGLPDGFDIPQMPEALQEYAPDLDKNLKGKTKLRNYVLLLALANIGIKR